jgi:hypothetical protein
MQKGFRVRMLRRPARYLNERVAGDGEFSPVSVPAGILGINACATSGGSLRDTANPNALSIKKLLFSCNSWGCNIKRNGNRRQFPVMEVGNDLIPEGEKSILVGIFIFMNMEGRDIKGIVPPGADFIIGDAFKIHHDMEHQHVEMQ